MSRPERMRRVDEAMKKVISEAIPTLKDPRIGFVTVTSVETSRDLDHAKVWLSVFGSEKQRDRTLEALGSAAGVLQAAEGLAYVTDSSAEGPNGIVVIDLATGKTWRKLHDHPSTKAEKNFLPSVEGRAIMQKESPDAKPGT